MDQSQGKALQLDVEHAAFMQRAFAEKGVPCAMVSGQTPAA